MGHYDYYCLWTANVVYITVPLVRRRGADAVAAWRIIEFVGSLVLCIWVLAARSRRWCSWSASSRRRLPDRLHPLRLLRRVPLRGVGVLAILDTCTASRAGLKVNCVKCLLLTNWQLGISRAFHPLQYAVVIVVTYSTYIWINLCSIIY